MTILERVSRSMERSPGAKLWREWEMREIADEFWSDDGQRLFAAAALLRVSPLRGFAPFIVGSANELTKRLELRGEYAAQGPRTSVNRTISHLLSIVAHEFGYLHTTQTSSVNVTGFQRGRVFAAKKLPAVLDGYFE